MELLLQRRPSVADATIGTLCNDNRQLCYTLEDTIREVPGQPVASWKIPGHTAIPAGRYQIVMTPSARFKRTLPLLLNVPGFEGIRIHPGNSEAASSGCILAGLFAAENTITHSRAACDMLNGLFLDAFKRGEQVWITIKNP